jgi:predicted O-methyltransferase YrrM
LDTNITDEQNRLVRLMWDVYYHVTGGGAQIYEGGASSVEATYLQQLSHRSGSVTVAEIGFNIGFSSIAFLESTPETTVVSFELDRRPAVELAKDFIDEQYPGRHELVIGDSRGTVPQYADARGGGFDFVFVDGGHEYEVAMADIQNARRLAKPNGWVVIDDVIPWFPWGVGPYRAWQEAIANGLIKPVESFVDGHRVDVIEQPGDRAWATGRFG